MGKILKAGNVNINLKKPVFIPNRQKLPKPEEKLAPEEEAFTEEVFRAIPPEHLAGSGETFESDKKESSENNENQLENDNDSNEHELEKKHRSQLSETTKKSRHMAALETIKIRELELEALEAELKDWETSLREKEKELSQLQAKQSQEITQKRAELEKESKSIIQLARESAQSLTESAQKEAQSIKKSASAEAESIREKAQAQGQKIGEEKGFSKGEAEGFKEAQLDWKNLIQETETIIKELQTSRISLLKSSEEEMLKLVIAFSKAIIKVEPMIQPEIILKNLDVAINQVSDADKIIMKINLKDKAMCQQHKEDLLAKLGSISELQVIEDSSLSPGGVKIETDTGTVDATIENQARELERALMDKFRKLAE